jgi:hypothetical protein
MIERPYVIKADVPAGTIMAGEYDEAKHVIRVRRCRREQAWSVLFHEETHMHLSDLGVSNLLSDEMQEAICDAIATARMADMVRMLAREAE